MSDPNIQQLNYHIPDVSTAYDEPLLRKKRAVGVRAGLRSFLKLPLLDNRGQVVDLTQCGINTGTGAAYVQYALNGNQGPLPSMTGIPQVATRYSEAVAGSATVQVTADAVDAPNGVVMCEIPTNVTNTPGIYLAELAILDATGTPIFSNEVYVYNENSAWGGGRTALPALDDMRLSLRDNDPAENELIDNYDFGLPELAYAAVRTVRFWNNQPPPIGGTDSTGFPNPEIWFVGTQLFLFELAEEHYRRNRLPYSAGQTQLDDKAKAEDYNKAFMERMQRFKTLVIHTKAAMNMSRGFGAFGGRYGGWR
jgi:hypothetical protein